MKVAKCRLIIQLLAVSISTAYADDVSERIISQHQDRRIQSWQDVPVVQPLVNLPIQPILSEMADKSTLTVELDEQELQHHPQLISRGLMAALLNHNAQDVMFFLPLYQALPDVDQEPLLREWATALIAEYRGKYPIAIEHYQRLVDEYPDVPVIRLQLAMVLFADRRYKHANWHFEQVLSYNVPTDIAYIIKNYQQVINDHHNWQVSGNFHFLQDKNINNAPKNRDLGGGWTAPQRESARGVGFSAGVGKRWAMDGGLYTKVQLETQGKYYWNNKGYNELTSTVSAGLGYQTARFELSVSPFVEQNHYADGSQQGDLSRFSHSVGMTLQGGYWLTPKWQATAYTQVATQRYRTRKHLDGLTRHTGITVAYAPNTTRYWFFGTEYHRVDTQDVDDSFIRQNIRAGVSQSWHDFSVKTILSYGKKSYRGMGFFGKIQHNQERNISTSVGYDKLHIFGMSPRLTWQYQKVDSNIPLYEYDKNHVFVEMSRQF